MDYGDCTVDKWKKMKPIFTIVHMQGSRQLAEMTKHGLNNICKKIYQVGSILSIWREVDTRDIDRFQIASRLYYI